MTHRSSSFRDFQPSKNALGPRTTVWVYIPEVSQVPSGRGDRGTPGHSWDFSLSLRFPGTAAGPAHALKGCLHPCCFRRVSTAGGRQVPPHGAAQGYGLVGVRWQGDQGLCVAVKTTLIFFHLL